MAGVHRKSLFLNIEKRDGNLSGIDVLQLEATLMETRQEGTQTHKANFSVECMGTAELWLLKADKTYHGKQGMRNAETDTCYSSELLFSFSGV